MEWTETNRHGDDITIDTAPECRLFGFRCIHRREAARAKVQSLSLLTTSARERRDMEPVHIEFVCEGPTSLASLGPLAVMQCNGPTPREVNVQLKNQLDS